MDEVIVGKVGRAHGLRGDVVVHVVSDVPQVRFAAGATVSTANGHVLTVDSFRAHGEAWLAQFVGVTDRTAADELRGQELYACVDEAEEPVDPHEFYDRHLVGLDVVVGDETVGTVVAVEHPPAQDLLVVRVRDVLRYVPFVAELVPVVDLATGTCTVSTIPGLLDDDVEEAR